MAHKFLSGTLWGKPLREYQATQRQIAVVLGVISGIGGPLSVGAVWFLAYRLAAFPAQPGETLAGFLGLMGLALAVTDRVLRRALLQPRGKG